MTSLRSESSKEKAGKWVVEGVFSEERDARMAPFEAIAVPLHRLWV